MEGVPVSYLCDELGIKPTQYYAWQKQFFEYGGLAFQRRNGKNQQQPNADQKKIAALQEKLQKRDEVVAELLQEHVQLKKRTWGTLNGCWVPHDTRDAVVDYVRRWRIAPASPPSRSSLGWVYYLSRVLDGYSRYLLHWEIREAMLEEDVEVVLQRTREKYPDARSGRVGRPGHNASNLTCSQGPMQRAWKSGRGADRSQRTVLHVILRPMTDSKPLTKVA